MKIMKLVANNVFPLDSITFLLFLENDEWFSEDKFSNVKYLYPEMVYLWNIGRKLFHGRFLRIMSGPKKQGQIVQIQLIGVSMTPNSQISNL